VAPRDRDGDGTPSPLKLYYRIGEVAALVGVEPHVLRYWETEFRSIKPQKSRTGQRVYSRRDVDRLLKVKELLYEQGFTIAGARKRLRETGAEPPAPNDPRDRAVAQARVELELARDELLALLADLRTSEEPRSAPGPASSQVAAAAEPELVPAVRPGALQRPRTRE
jgi:DNA-binding transcriptional MerR regulator